MIRIVGSHLVVELMRQGLAPATRERRRNEFQKYQELTGVLFRAGVPLLAGTDAPEPYCPPGFALHQELELLVEAGLTPVAALQAATINNARALKQGHRLGSVEAGKLADLIILDADPAADIRNTRTLVHSSPVALRSSRSSLRPHSSVRRRHPWLEIRSQVGT